MIRHIAHEIRGFAHNLTVPARDIKADICQGKCEHHDPQKDPDGLLDEDLQGAVVLDSIEKTRDMFVRGPDDEIARQGDYRDHQPRKIRGLNAGYYVCYEVFHDSDSLPTTASVADLGRVLWLTEDSVLGLHRALSS